MPPTPPIVEVELTAKAETSAALPATTDDLNLYGLIRQLAIDDRVNVDKMAAILDMKRGLEADRARAEYQRDFAAMTEKLPVITKKGAIKNREGKVQSKYALYEDIQRVIKPILREFGFTLNHEQTPENSTEMVLTTFLIHRGGHSQRSTFRSGADTSGSKNSVQGLGSIAQYAKRYNVVALLDLEMHGDDDDAVNAGQMSAPPGFPEWIDQMQQTSLLGSKSLTDKWQKSAKVFQDTILAKDWEAMKAAARLADKAAERG